jgi:energy-coupling factor transporter ATP-binding protein EcfA2
MYVHASVLAGGVADVNHSHQLAQRLISAQQTRDEVLHLYMDADRVFPTIDVSDADVLAHARQDPLAPQWARQQAAIATQNLYLDWMRAMLGAQQRLQSEFLEAAQRAEREGRPQPKPGDPLDSYRAALKRVLPHLQFVRLDQQLRRLIYDSAGAELPYEDLSGGERELAFLVGQIERFGIRQGLFLLDEPELHLNTELLRRWLDYLRTVTETGQVWIATHSLEAVETAGVSSTLVMDRGEDRMVRRIEPLGDRPALAALAPLLGTPAFSLVDTRFLLVEGDRPGRERERFVRILDANPNDRFLEAGGCREVLQRLAGLRLVASES